jgi:hypothetical protein
MRRGNLIHPLRHSEERIVRRENPILCIYEKPKKINDEILTRESTAQDDACSVR